MRNINLAVFASRSCVPSFSEYTGTMLSFEAVRLSQNNQKRTGLRDERSDTERHLLR